MKTVDFLFQTEDGASLHVSGWAVESPKAVVQVLLGMAEHSSRYARLAAALTAAGYATYACVLLYRAYRHASGVALKQIVYILAVRDAATALAAYWHRAHRVGLSGQLAAPAG